MTTRSSLTRPHRTDDFHARLRAARDVHTSQEHDDPALIQARKDVSDAALIPAAIGVVAFLWLFIHLAAAAFA